MTDNRLLGMIVLSASLAAGACLSAGDALADSVRIRVDQETLQSRTSVTNKISGETFDSEVSRYNQQYDFSLNKTVYPNLAFFGGALYELTDTETSAGGQDIQTKESFLKPFARLSLNTPLIQASTDYNYTEISDEFSGGESTRQYQDDFNTLLGWRPVGLPEFTFRYNQSHRRDDADTQDALQEDWSLESTYLPVDGLQLFYSYRNEESSNRITNQQSTRDYHNGRIDYAHGFFQNRLSLSTGYRFFYNRLVSESEDIVDTEIIPAAGLFSIDDTPEDGPALAVNNALIDGILGVSAGIDIGLGGDETTLTNIGIDLGLPTEINRVLLWVDRRLTPSVANAFSWQIYTSPDNLDTSTWTLAATVSQAPFGAFDNRFEIVFPTVTTRFIKLVVRPLSPALPGSIDFPNIFVTEIEPFEQVNTSSFRSESDSLDQNVNFGLVGRLSEKTTVGYDFFYRIREQDRFGAAETDKSSELSNGLFLRYIFNPTFSANARVQRTETDVNQERTADLSYSASLRADYMETFDQILTYSGSQSEVAEGTSSSQSLFLRNNLQLYRGWSAFADAGLTYDTSVSSERTDTTTLRLGTNVVPHETVNVNLDYQWRQVQGSRPEDSRLTDADYNIQVFYVPFPTLSFFGKYTLRERQEQRTSLQNYSVNWSPFPDGALQISLNFNETLEPEADRLSRNFGPFVKWRISRHLSVEAQHSVFMGETAPQDIDTQSFQAKVSFIW